MLLASIAALGFGATVAVIALVIVWLPRLLHCHIPSFVYRWHRANRINGSK
jgi:hypothetical protein